MILFHKNTRGMASKSVHFFIILCFLANLILPGTGFAQVLNMPQPGTMLHLSASYAPALLTGIKINPENPLEFHFIVNDGDDDLSGDALRGEAEKMIRYFLASLTIPQQDLWVNLSPYEKDRIAPDALATTDIGRDLLAQDYLLKQITASLIYPEGETGKKFWERIYKKAYETYGTTEIPVDTFNKVWIMPDKAVVYEHDNMVFVAESSLKVMLEKDYLASQKNNEKSIISEDTIASNIVREIVIPELQKEVNTGKNFAALRQVYNSLILATWFKRSLRESLLGHIYVDKSKVKGIDLGNTQAKEEIYQQYLAVYQKGAYNYIKTEYDQHTQKNIPRKYFSGGFTASSMVPVSVAAPTFAQQRIMAPDNDNTDFVVALETPKRMSSSVSSSLTNEEFIDQVKRLANAGAGQYGTIKRIDIFKGPTLLASFNKTSFSKPEAFQNGFTNSAPDEAERIVVSYVQPLIAQLILVRDEKNNWMQKGALPSAIDPRLLSSLSRMRVQDIADKNLKGKTVLVLDDLNVPMDGGNITDFSRIDAAMETIKYLQSKGAKVVIMSHLGRPKGKVKEEFSLAPIYTYIKETALKGSNVHFDPLYQTVKDAKDFVASMKEGEVLILQNTRFNPGEEAISNAEDALAKAKKGGDAEEIRVAQEALEPARQKHEELAQAYFEGVDVFVNDAFSVDHRGYASVIGAPKSIPRVAGLLVQEETEALKKFLEGVEAVAMGGSKVSDKIKIIRNLLKSKKLKYLLVGGAMRNAFLKAMGVDVKESFGAGEKEVAVASELNDPRIIIPVDVVATPRLSEDAQAQAKAGTIFETKIFDVADLKSGKESIPDGWELVDIGPKTVELYRKLILESKLTFMNGAMGIFEIDQFEDGTKGVLEAMADAKDVGGYTGVGGGDTVTAVNKFKILYERFGHVFLAGGATLEVLEEKVLPGLGALSFGSSNIILVKMPSSATWRELVQMFRAQASEVKVNNVEASRENRVITGKITKETRNSYSGVIRTEVIGETKKEDILREDDFLAMEIFEGHFGQEMPKKIRISFTKENGKGNIVFVRQNGIWDIDKAEGIEVSFSSSPLDGLDPEAEGVHGIVHLTRVYDDPSRPLIKLTVPAAVPLFNVNDDIRDLKGLENFIADAIQVANQNAQEGVKPLEDMETYASTDADGSGFRFSEVFTPRNRAWLEGLDKITHARFNFSGSRALIFFRDTEKKQWIYKEAEDIDVQVGSSGIEIPDLGAGFKPDDVIKMINEAVGQEVANNGIKVMLGHVPGTDYEMRDYSTINEALKKYISEIVINYKNGWRISVSCSWAGAGWKVHTFVDPEGKTVEFVQDSGKTVNIPLLKGALSVDDVIKGLDAAVGQESIKDETLVSLGFFISNTALRKYSDLPTLSRDMGKEIRLFYKDGSKLVAGRDGLPDPWEVRSFVDRDGKKINVSQAASSSALKVGDIIREDGVAALQKVADDRGLNPWIVEIHFSDDDMMTFDVAQEGSLAAVWEKVDGSDDIVSVKVFFAGKGDFVEMEALNTLNSAWKVKDIRRDVASSAVLTGGIDFKGIYDDLKIKTDASGVPLKIEFQNMDQIQIEGFVPVIIQILPMNNLPALLGFNPDVQNSPKVAMVDQPLAIREE